MAITAAVTLTSAAGDLLTDALALSDTADLTTAGTSTAVSQTTGLARTNFTNNPIQSKVIYRSDDATANGANKVYLKNLSSTATEYFTVFIDQEEMGRLYAGDWAFFPWTATSGTKETFVATIANTWAAGDTWEFDGVQIVAANSTVADIAAQIDGQEFPNWTTTRSTAAVTFVAREAQDTGTVVTATADIAIDTAGDGDSVVSSAAMGTATESDIIVVPSVVTTMDLEHVLFLE
tara:strand:- start:1078 stop:1782 length:705 start_codon:yes stop_codon:yes gene_type:complete